MPMNRANYPANWKEFSKEIRFGRAGGRCECAGECGRTHDGGRCEKETGKLYPSGQPVETELGDVETKSVCILTVAHLNAKGGCCTCEPRCANHDHVRAMCQGCHLRYDGPRHQLNASDTRDRKSGQLRLPLNTNETERRTR